MGSFGFSSVDMEFLFTHRTVNGLDRKGPITLQQAFLLFTKGGIPKAAAQAQQAHMDSLYPTIPSKFRLV
jgi:hypothetical protein